MKSQLEKRVKKPLMSVLKAGLLIVMWTFIFSPILSANLNAGGDKMKFTITSSAFSEGGMIPGKHTCDGSDISPDLSWEGVPEDTKSLALICDDPDAPMGTWVHWVLFNIPASEKGLPAKIVADATLSNGALHGTNDFRRLGYGGPCPPGGTHRYYFKLYALDTVLPLDAGATKAKVEASMAGHILGQAQLMGKYKR
jgi:Raf kinase inhibitor-like YbhB/YbcL family protein